MANYNKMTESKYTAIKILLKGGATVKEAAQYLQVSTAVVYGVKNTENFAEYCQIGAEREARKKQAAAIRIKEQEKAKEAAKEQEKANEAAKEPERQPGTTMTSTYQLNRMYEALKAQNELLKLISEKLAFIVEQLA